MAVQVTPSKARTQTGNDVRVMTQRLLVGVLILAFFLRVWGINFGLPYLYHPDEPGYVGIAQTIFKTGDLNPHFFHYPSLFLYLNALAYIPYFWAGKLAGVFNLPTNVPYPIVIAMGVGKTPMSTTFLMGRTLTAIFGSLSVLLVFFIGRRLADERVGLLASLLLAISPTNVQNSRFITPDTFLVFFLLLSFWGSSCILGEGKIRHYILAGVGAGLAMSSKYNGYLVLIPLVVAHIFRHGISGLRRKELYVALVLSGAAFLLTTPYAILDHQSFIKDLRFEAEHYATGHGGMEGNTLTWYLSYLWRFEGPIILLALLEITLSTYKHVHVKESLFLSSFAIPYFVFISSFVVRNDRTLMPVIPFLFLLASFLLVDLFKRENHFLSAKRTVLLVILGVVSLTLIAWPLRHTIDTAVQLTMPDGRETSRVWIEENLPSGARVAIESYSPFIPLERFSVRAFNRIIEHPPEWYVDEGFDYIIVSQGMFGRYFREPKRYANEVAQYEALFQKFSLTAAFDDAGYEVRIYRVRP